MSLTNKQIQDWYAAGYLTEVAPVRLGPGSSRLMERLTAYEQQHLTIMAELVELGMRPKPASDYAWALLQDSTDSASQRRTDGSFRAALIGLGNQYWLSRVHSGHPLRGLKSSTLER